MASTIFAVGVASAQISTTTLFGTVTDTTGATIPNATVTVMQTETNLTCTVTTKDEGSYRAEFLPVGPYRVKAEAKGFKSLEQTGITLTVMEAAHLDLPLSVGEASETVSVTSELPLVNSANATLGRTVDNKEIDNLPLVNRNVYQLLTLTAGVQSLIVFPDTYKWPYNYQINFGVQQQLTNTLAVGISYVGALARKLPMEIDHNYPLYNTANPATNVTSITSSSPAGAVATNNRRPILPGQI